MSESESTAPKYTVDVNRKQYELNEDVRRAIQQRAEREYEENRMFSCWWKVATPEQYTDEEWEENIHEAGDPVLVIETEGPIVPWDRLDKLNVEMQNAGVDTGMDSGSGNSTDAGNGMQTIDRDEVTDDTDDPDKVIGRTHFEQDPREYEEVESPDGEEEDKIPPAPSEMPDHPVLVKWVPDYPEVEHTWAAGKAITSSHSWVEWNVQQYANQPRPAVEKDDGHDHWESLLQSHNCEQVSELGPSQDVPSSVSGEDDESSKQEDDIGGKYGGNNWAV